MYQGWSVQVIWRFTINYDLVAKEWDCEVGTLFEEQFLQYMQDKKQKENQKNAKKNNEYEMCRHDLWVMEDDINCDSNTTANLESGHNKNDVSFFHNTGEKMMMRKMMMRKLMLKRLILMKMMTRKMMMMIIHLLHLKDSRKLLLYKNDILRFLQHVLSFQKEGSKSSDK